MPREARASRETARSSHRIVAGVDGSEAATRALAWAAAQADRTGAVLEIQTAYEPGYSFITRDEVERIMDRLVEESAKQVAALTPGVTTKGETHERSPATALIEASQGADLLVVGSRGMGGFKGLLLGSVSQKCCLHAHCPVTVVH
jgi:nucleotide-binding universal stress UspA family protein